MGMFDDAQTQKKYNDAQPNYDKEDGIDNVECTKNCTYRDVKKNRCLYETCILKQGTRGIPSHKSMTKKCKCCGQEYNFDVSEDDCTFNRLSLGICDKCSKKLMKMIDESPDPEEDETDDEGEVND